MQCGAHLEIINWLIEKGANDWNKGLINACRSGNIDIAYLMIENGADDWDEGLIYACAGKYLSMINLMIEKGATYCYNCGKSSADHRR